MSSECVVWVHSESETEQLGRQLAQWIPPGTTICMVGTLGAGKTRLTQAIASGLGLDAQQVVSPTFTLCQHYVGTKQIYHLDVYRLADEDEFLELGPEEFFESPAITIVEWGDRVRSCLPDEYLEVRLTVESADTRAIHFKPIGGLNAGWLAQLSKNNG